MKIEINIKELNERKYEYLKEVFMFPEYFGNNLDALYDVLTDYTELTVIYNDILSANDYSGKIISVINKAVHDIYMEDK